MPMTSHCRFLPLIPMMAAAPLFAAAAACPATTDFAEAGRRADRLLAELVQLNGVPGMGAAVWRHDRIVWRGSAGYQDVAANKPVDADTLFRLASVSKLVTVAAAARLAEDGRLDLDAPVSSQWHGSNPAWAPMTLRQIAAHTSGLPHYQSRDEDRGDKHYASTAEAVGIFRDRPLIGVPGAQYHYSSWGYTLMSAVIEARAGKPFLDYVAETITPGLTIVPDATHSGNPHASRTYEFDNGRVVDAPRHDFSYTWAGGGFSATPSALAEFGGRMMRGQVVPLARFQAMRVPMRLNDGAQVRTDDYAVGFGWRTLTDQDGRLRAQHAGVTLGARSALVTWPELPETQRMAVSLLSNALWESSIEQSAAMLAAPFQPTPANLVHRDCPVATTRFKAEYRNVQSVGKARFVLEDGACTGRIAPEGELKAYFDRFVQKDVGELSIVSLDDGAGLSRAALVTPIGIYDLRAEADGSHVARVGASSVLRLEFNAAK